MPALAPPRSYPVADRIGQGGIGVRLKNLTGRVTLNKWTENQRNQERQSDVLHMLSIAKELRAWGRHYNQAVHALNIVARYLRGRGDADEAEIADALLSARAKLDDVENGRHRIEARLDELCCLDAIRGR